jgi:hypothetical protein|nr:MAG TPA: hypothetical protein [Caudoviricetes sp.]
MAFEIVDGMTGTKHISSDDLAALNTATVGKADCVLEYGNDFALTMASANTATLGTGVGMVGGKRFWNQASTSLTIQSGTQGQKRNDLVVARYAKTSAGIESITPVVIKGTPTTGTPADPNTTANDLRLWRIPLNGINAGTPVRLFEPVTPLATLGDSVSQGGEQPFPGGYLYRFGPLYVLQIQNMTIQAGVVRTAGKLPVKPSREVVGAISYGSSAGYVSVHADGTVYCTSKAAGDFSGQVCFVA